LGHCLVGLIDIITFEYIFMTHTQFRYVSKFLSPVERRVWLLHPDAPVVASLFLIGSEYPETNFCKPKSYLKLKEIKGNGSIF
jgi:hypothetical protein